MLVYTSERVGKWENPQNANGLNLIYEIRDFQIHIIISISPSYTISLAISCPAHPLLFSSAAATPNSVYSTYQFVFALFSNKDILGHGMEIQISLKIFLSRKWRRKTQIQLNTRVLCIYGGFVGRQQQWQNERIFISYRDGGSRGAGTPKWKEGKISLNILFSFFLSFFSFFSMNKEIKVLQTYLHLSFYIFTYFFLLFL